MKIAIYARYSSKGQQELSIEGQLRECEYYCQSKGYEIADYYIDRAKTGRTDAREEFERMIHNSTKQNFDAVLVYKLSRFFRNRTEAAIYRKKLRMNNVMLISVTEQIPEGRGGIYYEAILEAEAEAYSIGLSEDTKRGLHDAALKCQVTGSLPYGYKTGSDKKYQIVENEAEIVRQIFSMYISGQCAADICSALNESGYRTRKNNFFEKTSILKILKNEKYMGVYQYNDIRVENGCPEIVPKSTFLKAQKILLERGGKNSSSRFMDYPLAGKLFCGICNSPMYGDSSNKKGVKYHYYNCKQRRKYNNCSQLRINKDEMEENVYAALKYFIEPNNIEQAISVLKGNIDVSEDKKKLETLLIERDELKIVISNLLVSFENGMYSISIKNLLQERESQLLQLNSKIKELEQSLHFNSIEAKLRKALKNLAKKDLSKEKHKKRLINSLLKQVYFLGGDSLENSQIIVVVSPMKLI